MGRAMGRLCVLLALAIAVSGCSPGNETATSSSGGRAGGTRAPGESPSKPPKEKRDKGKAEVVDPAPDFSVETFDGDVFSLAEQRGTPVVLNFWESW